MTDSPDLAAPTWVAGEVASFVAVGFGSTWLFHGALVASGVEYSPGSPTMLLYLAGLLGPSAAAFLLERRTHGPTATRDLLALGAPRTSSPPAVLCSLLLPVATAGLAAAAAGHNGTVTFDPLMVVGQLWVVTGEEFGWRGWLWPRTTDRFGPLGGTILVTVLWGLWHAPMFLVADSPQAQDGFIGFVAAITGWGLLHGALQLHRRSVFTAMVFHAASNVAVSTFEVSPTARSVVHGITAVVTLAALAGWSRRALPRPDGRVTRRGRIGQPSGASFPPCATGPE